MRAIAAAAFIVGALVPAAALAQAESEAAAPLEDRPALKINEVERGFYFGAEAGGLFLFSPKGTSGSGFSTGRTAGITVGGDIGEFASLGLMVLGTHTDTPSAFIAPQPKEGSQLQAPLRGDFSSLVLGATAKISLLGTPDANGVKRFFIYVRAGGGLALTGPKDFFPDNSDILLLGGAGCEYFTHLRHFSIGIDADFVLGLKYFGAGFMVSPNLRYAF